MKSLTLAIITLFAGCATENIQKAPTANPASEKIYYTQTSSPTDFAVLLSKDARIEGTDLVWSCVYRTPTGRVVIEQREECQLTH